MLVFWRRRGQPTVPAIFFFSSRRVGVCEEGRVVTRPPFFFCDRLVLYRFIEIEPRHFFFSLFAPFFFLSRRFRIAASLAAIAICKVSFWLFVFPPSYVAAVFFAVALGILF